MRYFYADFLVVVKAGLPSHSLFSRRATSYKKDFIDCRLTKGSATIRVFRSLRNRNYLLFWSCDLLASVGHFIREVALYWIAYEITGSAMALGVLGLCEAAPRLVLGALAGALVDRHDRLRLLVLTQFASALPVFAFLALYLNGVLEFWHLLALEVVFGAIRSINPSASQSLLRDLVSSDDLMNAVALYTLGFNLARVLGPSLGGVSVLWIGVGGCFFGYGVSLVLSGLGMLFIRLPRFQAGTGEHNLLREIREGVRYSWGAPVILASIGAGYVLSVFVGTYQRFLPVFAKEVLDVGPDGLGMLMAAPGLGAIVSVMFLATIGEKWRREFLLWATATVTPLFLILFCVSRNFFLSVGLLALVGGGQISFRTISRVIIQIEVPHSLLGRVMSIFNLDQGMRSVGSLVIGAFATLFGAALGLGLTSLMSLAATTALFYRLMGSRPRARA